MTSQPFINLSLLWIVVIFAVSSALVWFAGTRLSKYADQIAKKTGLGHVVIGTLLLASITSLPEVATTVTASTMGDADIAVNNLLGGIALQTTLLVVGDIVLGKRSLSSLVESPPLGLYAISTILLLALAAAVILIDDVAISHVGIGSSIILFLFAGCYYLISYFESIDWWKSNPDQRDGITAVKKRLANDKAAKHAERHKETRSFRSTLKSRLFAYVVFAALAVLIGGYLVVRSGQAFAAKTGLASNLVGAVLIAVSTSLPELSTTIASVRMKQYTLAFSNIFGTNVLTVALIFLADICYTKGPVLNEVDAFAAFSALVGIAVTTLYMIGLSVRLRKSILNMGYDSLLVLLTYLTGVFIMFMAFDK